MTSVKDLHVDAAPTKESLGEGRFKFTDDYSVFDWGKMPDEIPRKGAALCAMGAATFEFFEENAIPTHYEGVVVDGETYDLANAPAAPEEMRIELTQVPDLPFDEESGYDYEAYHAAAAENYLIPLEIVFRNAVPVGSSLRTRKEPADVGLDADEWPEESVDLPEPVVEFSTKYEEQDRYLTRVAAEEIAGRADLDRLEELALAVDHLVTELASRAGLTHEDGKIECLYVDGTIQVADVTGTFDENRFSYGGQEVSKEVVRQHYKEIQPEWVDAVSAAKAEADERGVADWKQFCDVEPVHLDDDVVRAVGDMYAAGADAYAGTDFFDAPSLDDAVDAVREL
ncbi:phosphoribosylaminoimidazolesuccinocarboxamide synthase [Halospeciosus flavus]|uniref:Phosphoribosylaminoimidazole-succinocarboxamide synthase n=1 Tax=Halospeciosus flavus TaxID=3032283 RepID=A0ABD5Z892_9EURY|nr:phosphoribosylaminoimidazolesuccinocarboxamide synthase [Halospeciosus flavus]